MSNIQAEHAKFDNCVMWNNDFKNATMTMSSFRRTKLCDGNFEGMAII